MTFNEHVGMFLKQVKLGEMRESAEKFHQTPKKVSQCIGDEKNNGPGSLNGMTRTQCEADAYLGVPFQCTHSMNTSGREGANSLMLESTSALN